MSIFLIITQALIGTYEISIKDTHSMNYFSIKCHEYYCVISIMCPIIIIYYEKQAFTPKDKWVITANGKG